MASYIELRGQFEEGSPLANRVCVAVVVAVDLIRAGEDDGTGEGAGFTNTPAAHDLRKTWAKDALTDLPSIERQALKHALAQNRSVSIAAIEGSSDANLQTAVNKAVDLLAGN